MSKDNKFLNVPKEKFEFANLDERIGDKKFDTKPISYLQDAFIRFSKNKASVVATIIIILIILFALIVPIATPKSKRTLRDTYYNKKGPRVEGMSNIGIFDGGYNSDYSYAQLMNEYGKCVGAVSEDDNILAVKDTLDSKYQSVLKVKGNYLARQGKNYNPQYSLRYDKYLNVGFIYKDIEQQEYENIKKFEEEKGIQVLFPLIDKKSEYFFDSNDSNAANYWYKVKRHKQLGNAVPVKTEGGSWDWLLDFDEENPERYSIESVQNLKLEDNYLRDSSGNLVYYEYVGGGDFHSAQYRVRVLYYNYFTYKNGYEPFYLLGTDTQGYDLAYRMANGIQLSLLVAVVVSVINFIIGAIYGAIEGYYGGAIDMILERVSDILAGVPFIIVATLFQMYLANKVGPIPSLLFAFVMTGWIGTASRVRSQFYRFKNQEYVMAARTLGAKDRRIIWKHIFPNTLGTLITSSALVIPSVIFSESMLSFLGIVNLGGSKRTSLGTLLSDASGIWTDYPHLMVCPAVVISLLMICFNLFGNGLRDAFNPTLRGTGE